LAPGCSIRPGCASRSPGMTGSCPRGGRTRRKYCWRRRRQALRTTRRECWKADVGIRARSTFCAPSWECPPPPGSTTCAEPTPECQRDREVAARKRPARERGGPGMTAFVASGLLALAILDGAFSGFRASVGRTGLIDHRAADRLAARRGVALALLALTPVIAGICVDAAALSHIKRSCRAPGCGPRPGWRPRNIEVAPRIGLPRPRHEVRPRRAYFPDVSCARGRRDRSGAAVEMSGGRDERSGGRAGDHGDYRRP
jgi:hypothetical protein